MKSGINELELKKLLSNMKKLPAKLNKGIVTLGVKAAAKTIQEAAKHNVVPDLGGHLEKNSHNMSDLEDAIAIKKKSKRSTRQYTVAYKVGIKLDGTADFANYVEWGSKIHTPQPFMTPALHQNGREAFNDMVLYMKKRFDREVKKGRV